MYRSLVHRVCLIASIVVCGSFRPVRADEDLAAQAYRVLEKYCYDCHGVDDNFEGLNVLKRDILLKERGKLKDPFVSPGHPEKSKLFGVIADGRMPIGDEKLTQAETELLRNWITGGAAFPVASRTDRPFIAERSILQSIRDDLRSLSDRESRGYTRYFSIAHLHNNPEVSEKQLRYTRAGLSKAINSLSREARIVLPRAVDPHQTIFALDLRDVGWDDLRATEEEKVWTAVLGFYPYGVEPTTDYEAGDMYEEITNHFAATFLDNFCYLRADWFVEAATKPPLYHKLANIPKTFAELARSMGISSIQKNVADGRIVRGAVLKSGVSAQNRLMDRHEGINGAFWVSYDFAANSGLSNVARFPLGPEIKDPQLRYEYNEHAFKEDGSELIWELKNGLHGYMIVDGKGNRIDRAPVSIVWNKAQANFNPEVVNGVSCMGCHTHGMRDFNDILLDGHALNDREAIRFLRRVVPTTKEMRDKYLQPDRLRYLARLQEATGPFLQVGEDQDKDITRFPEPITKVVMEYGQPLTANDAAFEVGLENVSQLVGLRRIGLGILEKEGGVVQRTFWAPTAQPSTEDPATYRRPPTSIFERVVNHLDRGLPIK